MHSVEKKELTCENRSSKIEETKKEIIENYPQLPQGKNLEQHDTIFNVPQMPTVCMSSEKALHLN